MLEQTLREGALFHDKYQVVRAIAQGGMGAVYEVVHLETQRRRALKVMLPSVVNSEELRNRFRAEARVASGIESEHIVETFDAGVDRATGMPFLVMELLRGEELASAIKGAGRLSPERALPLLAQVARTLDRTHAARVVHRDLKPENIFLTTREDGSPHVKILDFGIAKIVAEQQGSDRTRSLGTPLYMAPEQFDGSAPISPQTDLFALAHITYTMLVGVPYWSEEMRSSPSLYGFLMAMQSAQLEPPTHRAGRQRVPLPPGFDAWFARASAKRASDRFRTAGEQQAELERIFQGAAQAHSYAGQAAATAFATPMTGAMGHAPHQRWDSNASHQTAPRAGYPMAPMSPSTGGSGPIVIAAAPIAMRSSGGPKSAWIVALLVLVLGAGGIGALLVMRSAPKAKGSKSEVKTTAVVATDDAAPPDSLDQIRFTKKDPAVGSRTKSREVTNVKINLTSPTSLESITAETTNATTTILAADGKTVLKVKIQYGDVLKTVTNDGQVEKTASPVSNKTYIAEYKDGDIVATDESSRSITPQESEVVMKAAASLGKPSPELVALPDVPLKRGDRADTLAELVRGSLVSDSDGTDEFSDISVTLKDIKMENGVKVGIFETAFKATSRQPEFVLTMNVKGTMTIRADTGRGTHNVLAGPITMSGAGIAGTGTLSATADYE